MASIKIQRGSIVFGATEDSDTVTLTDAVASTSRAFVRVVGTFPVALMPAAGEATNKNVDDVGVTAVLTGTTTITFTRETSGANADVEAFWEVWEYTGTAGGADEFEVLTQEVLVVSDGSATASTSNVSPSAMGNLVPIICGIRCDNTAREWSNASFRAEVIGLSPNLGRVTRGGTSGEARCCVAMVDFKGSNWSVQNNIDHTFTAAGTDESETISTVTSWATAMLFSGMETPSGSNGIDETGFIVRAGATATSVLHFLRGGHSAPTGVTTTTHVVRHADLDVDHTDSVTGGGTAFGTGSGGLQTETLTIATQASMDTSAVIGFTVTGGTGTLYPRPFWVQELTSTTTVDFHRARSANAGAKWSLQAIDFSDIQTGDTGTAGQATSALAALAPSASSADTGTSGAPPSSTSAALAPSASSADTGTAGQATSALAALAPSASSADTAALGPPPALTSAAPSPAASSGSSGVLEVPPAALAAEAPSAASSGSAGAGVGTANWAAEAPSGSEQQQDDGVAGAASMAAAAPDPASSSSSSATAGAAGLSAGVPEPGSSGGGAAVAASAVIAVVPLAPAGASGDLGVAEAASTALIAQAPSSSGSGTMTLDAVGLSLVAVDFGTSDTGIAGSASFTFVVPDPVGIGLYSGVHSMSMIRAALRRHIVTELKKVQVTLADGSVVAPKVVAYKPENRAQEQDFPLIVVTTPDSNYGESGDDGLLYQKARLSITIEMYMTMNGLDDTESDALPAALADALDEGMIHPVEIQLARGLGLNVQAAEIDPLCHVWYPEFESARISVEGEGRDLVACGFFTVSYGAEAGYDRVPGGIPDDDFETLHGVFAGDEAAEDEVDRTEVQTEQPL